MKSYFVELTGIGKSHLASEEIDLADLADNEAVIKNHYSLISPGTELSRAFGLKKGFKYPVRPGYSTVGTLIDKGRNISGNIGDRVFVNCNHSSLIRWSDTQSVQGAHIFLLPEDISDLDALFINLALVAIQGVNLSEIKAGYKVGVFGLGVIGIITALIYQKMGMNVTGFDVVESRCKLSKNAGLKYTCHDQYEEYIEKFTDGQGFDITVDVTGLSKVIMDCIGYTRRYGQCILLGSPRQSYECDVTKMLSDIHMKNLKVIGAFNQSAPVNSVEGSNDSMMNNFNTVCDLIRNKDLDFSKLISRISDPKNCEKAYYDLMYNKDTTSCVVFDWNNY